MTVPRTLPRTGCTRSAPCKPSNSEYSSDEDECTSDQDDRGPAYESDDDDGYDRIANDDLDALMRCFDDEDAALIALARHLESLPTA